jgi:DNA (cytosine-5)-methyltransferase 1
MQQISLFCGVEPLNITKKIRLIELFAGIGAQAKALENIGADFEHYRICEFDKYAVNSYNAIHGTDFPVSDITKWHAADLGIEQKDKYEYIMSYSFPCQSLSVAGKGAGMAKGSGTRSGLLWEVERILEECDGNLPQVLLMENVDAILFEKNRKHFFQWCNRLEEFGYKNYYQVLNARDYGIPQNRKRCFMVSVLGDYYFEFPKPIKLELCVKDLLESEVAEKYYISAERVKELLNKEYDGKKDIHGVAILQPTRTDYGKAVRKQYEAGEIKESRHNMTKLEPRTDGISNTLTTIQKDNLLMVPNEMAISNPDIKQVGNISNSESFNGNPQTGRVYDSEYICPAINTMGGGQREPKFLVVDGIAIRTNNEKGYDIAQDSDTINLEQPNSKTRRGRVGKQIAQTIMTSTEQAVVEKEIISCEIRHDKGIVTYKGNVMGALRTISECGDKHIISYVVDRETGKPVKSYNYQIRKLTPRECFRLMGFKDIDFTKAKYKFDKESDLIYEIMNEDILESDKVKKIEDMGIKVTERTSNSQCYKQAGNSIVVDVLEAIFRNMNIKGVKRWQE